MLPDEAGRVTPCAPQINRGFRSGAHGVTRATMSPDLVIPALGCQGASRKIFIASGFSEFMSDAFEGWFRHP